MYFEIHRAQESRKSDVEIFYCEEGGRSGFVLLAKEMLNSPFQACTGQENFEKKMQVLLQVILRLFLSAYVKHSKSTWLPKSDIF